MNKLIAITLTALVAVSSGRPTVPQTFPLVYPVDTKPQTLPLVVPVKAKPQTFPLFERVGSTVVPKTFPMVEPVNPKQKTLPLVEPVKKVPKTFPLFETQTVVPKTFPLVEPIESKAKTLPLVVKINPKSRTFPLFEAVDKKIPKTFPLFEKVGSTVVPKTFPLEYPVASKPQTLPLVVPVESKPQVFPSYQEVPKASLNVPEEYDPRNLPVIVPVDSVGDEVPLFKGVEEVPKTLPLVQPVNPKQKTFPLVEPVKKVPKTFPLFEAQEVPKTFPSFNPIELSDANNQLGAAIMNNVNNGKDNVFLSPFSLSTVLAMLYSGAKGATAEQMRQVLGYTMANLEDDQVFEQYHHVLENLKKIQTKNSENSLNVANKMVVQKDFDILKSFQENLKKNFESTVDVMDFSDKTSADKINKWVSEQTKGKIQKLLDDKALDSTTKVVLLNAIYFKGVFQTKFDEELTKDDVFFTEGDQQKTTKMMRRNGKFNFTRVPELDSILLEIPYTGNDISLYVVLPNERQGMKKLDKDIVDWSLIEKNIENLNERIVDVTLPKFKIETSYAMKDTLSALGMSSVFTPSADLSGIDGRRDLEVSAVVHKAFVEVNEEGTEAAAATGIIINERASIDGQPMIPVFRADHPFMFFIRDNVNRMNLFVGQVNQL